MRSPCTFRSSCPHPERWDQPLSAPSAMRLPPARSPRPIASDAGAARDPRGPVRLGAPSAGHNPRRLDLGTWRAAAGREPRASFFPFPLPFPFLFSLHRANRETFPGVPGGPLSQVWGVRLWASGRWGLRTPARNCEAALKTKVPLAAKPVSALKPTGRVSESWGLPRGRGLRCGGQRGVRVCGVQGKLVPGSSPGATPRPGAVPRRTRGRRAGTWLRRREPPQTPGTRAGAQGPEATAPGCIPVTPPAAPGNGPSAPQLSCPVFWGLQGAGRQGSGATTP